MTRISTAIAVIAALAAGGALMCSTALATGFYPDKFKHLTDVPAPSGKESAIPPQYRSR